MGGSPFSGVLKNENIIFNIGGDRDFERLALEIFRKQAIEIPVYRNWIATLGKNPDEINEVQQIPFLPVEFFKTHEITGGKTKDGTIVFTSSGTVSQTRAKHFVQDISLYEESFTRGFKMFYGDPTQYCILALLPSYLERGGSSLVYMCDRLMKLSGHPRSGFYLNETDKLKCVIGDLKNKKEKVLLIGVSYALMDLADSGITLDDNFIVMETGGMKGTRKELLKAELYAYLKSGFGVDTIHSEYGMTEMLSQAYSTGDGLFRSPPWLRFYTREIDDPLKLRTDSRTGGVNFIDLANVNSCSFIATKDLGRVYADGTLELMGRYEESDVRGCNLLIENF
jgi:phenylacetate-coenzyme A ligase PaaK-like adenylate-forming protein